MKFIEDWTIDTLVCDGFLYLLDWIRRRYNTYTDSIKELSSVITLQLSFWKISVCMQCWQAHITVRRGIHKRDGWEVINEEVCDFLDTNYVSFFFCNEWYLDFGGKIELLQSDGSSSHPTLIQMVTLHSFIVT